MPLFDDDFLTKVRYVSLVSRRSGGGLLRARAARPSAGGPEPAGHRDYSPGDDYRAVDWNIAARHDELRTRQFAGETDRHVYLLLDWSASMALGEPPKSDVARRAAAAVAYAALADLDRVRLVTFTSKLCSAFGPIRDRRRFLQLTGYLEGLSPPQGETDLARAARDFARRDQRRGLAVVVSDWFDPGFSTGLDILRRAGYQPRVVQVYDPLEARPGTLGDWDLVDVESGLTWQVTLTERHVRRYRRAFEAHQQSLRRYCAAYAIGHAELPGNLPLEELLLKATGAKK